MAPTSSTDCKSEIINAFDEIAPPCASASTPATFRTPSQQLRWDVFINHRGPDVKHTLAKAMYHVLHATGLRVFLDSEELSLGDFLPAALQQAMRSAPLHVVIFSPTYAESIWCLAELSFMLKSGATIIPVFFNVQPTDLRWVAQGEGMYAKAFTKHQEKGRYSLEKLEEWKMALHSVSFYKGEIINNNESRIQHSNRRNLGNGWFWENHSCERIYNQKHLSVESSSFVFDVRGAAAKNELYKKQIELLQDIGFKGETFENIEKGKKIVSNCLKSIRLLIVLDDVDHMNQLDALLPTKDNLGLGSLIIVTTREKEVLRCWGVSSIYKMKTMNLPHARQLFCWHAFLQPSPSLEFEKLVEKFVSVCNGLPLSLKVLGGQLYGWSIKDLWKDLLSKISKILPLDIKICLRVSYDALDVQEKQIFLDIACFFIGKDYKSAIAVWEASGWNGLYDWNRLVNKCLVDIDHANRITMHDHLRDLGREIANTEPPFRIWSPEQITGIQKKLEERVQIRGMILNTETNDESNFPGFLVNTSTGLSRYLPSWLPLKNLRVLELEDSDKLKELWKNGADTPMHLRELGICGCQRFRRFPRSLGLLQHLEKIVVDHSIKLRSLPEEFCFLQSLKHLQLSNCEMLSSLPKNFGYLTNLQHLELSFCLLKEVPISFKQLRFLKHLSIHCCYKLTLESDILENMTTLEYLSLSELPQLKILPCQITNQASLRELYLKDTDINELPDNIGQLNKLRVLEIGSCKIRSLPESMGRLNLLERLELKSLAVVLLPQSFTQLINLHIITIDNCPISEFPFGQESFSSSFCKLEKLTLIWTRMSQILISEECCPGLQTLPTALKFIEVEYCTTLRNMRITAGLSNLQTLKIKDCPELDSVPSFAELTSLQIIEFIRCGRIKKIKGLKHCRSLNILIIFSCKELDAIPSLAELTSLRKIDLKECHKLSKIGSLQHCRSLEALLISDCQDLHSIASLADLISLRIFELRGRNKVEKIEGLQHCKSLKELVVEYTRWQLPCIGSSLEQMQRLKIVQLVAKKRSAIELCTKTIQRWPSDIIICTKAAPDAASIINPSAVPNLSVVQSFGKSKYAEVGNLSTARSFMLCLVINCNSPRMFLRLVANCYEESVIWLDEGRAIVIGMFAQHSRSLNSVYFNIRREIQSDGVDNEDNEGSGVTEVEKGFLVSGEENSMVEGFHRLFALLGN
ncbi:disease resistance protein RPV1-like [Cryptomeria japonica]|uniref:disease resistance protein RPV1-like n=1 Tax=Cryptomeria japonica TaxID=3369 RepID=UPI0027DA320A|nr:disease resistance protein RPV1-like [Cryptomeria japonica]